jgi:predicted MFS family arabinose efflux permease
MSGAAMQSRLANKWLVFGAACVPFFFINFATFISLGIVLRPMIAEMHWTFTQAGFCFTALGLACGLSSPLPAITMKRFGARTTFCTGTVSLCLGFLLASVAHSLATFYTGMAFVGLGFTFTGNVPGVYLISTSYRTHAARLIGFYLMVGALGQAFGPPIVEAIIKAGGWRSHWQAMAFAAAAMTVFCFFAIRDPSAPVAGAVQTETTGASVEGWTVRQAILTAQFMLLACAVAFTMTGITTIESIIVPHLAKIAETPHSALVLSLIALTSTGVKGLTGRLTESIRPASLVAAGLVLQAAGDGMLMVASTTTLQYLGAISFGAGWGLSIVAGTVGVLNFFGADVGSRAMSTVSLLVTVGVLGPMLAGAVRDGYGTFAPIFLGAMAIALALAIPIAIMRRPVFKSVPEGLPAAAVTEPA